MDTCSERGLTFLKKAQCGRGVGWPPLIPSRSPDAAQNHQTALLLYRRSYFAGPGNTVASEQYCSPVDCFQGTHAACFAQVQRHYQGDVEGL